MTEPANQPTPQEELAVKTVQIFSVYCEKNPGIKAICQYLASDQGMGFFYSLFHQRSGSRWASMGGNAAALIAGHQASQYLNKTAKALYTECEMDEVALCLLLIHLGRWCDLQSGLPVFVQDDREPTCPGSMSTNAIIAASMFGIKLSAPMVQAISGWWKTPEENKADHERFTSMWWVVSQSMQLILIAGGGRK